MTPKTLYRLAPPLAAALFAVAGVAARADVDHVEPPSWWVGMHAPRLELMLHGSGLAALTPRLAPGADGKTPAGVRLAGASPGTANYLFVDLDIAPDAQPATLTLELLDAQGAVRERVAYALAARTPGSAERRGFDSHDAIYLVVPDRFANGDPHNDTVAGLGDPADRAKPGGRHGGDLAGLEQHLDYIAGLGFTQLWPTPLVENRQPQYSYHGYSITDLYRIDPRFGTNAQYRDFVAAARARGLGVIQDVVPNHIGSGHWWLADLPAPDWINPSRPYVETNHRHSVQADPYAAPSDLARLTDGWFSPTMPDLNSREPHLATYLTQNAIWWIEYAGLSGLRVDTYPYSDRGFLARWSAAIMAEYPHFSMVGEEMSDRPELLAYWLRGHRNADGYASSLPALMDFPLYGVLREALTEPEGQGFGRGWGRLFEAQLGDLLYPEPERLVLLDGNHDTNRIYSAFGDDADLVRLALAFIATTNRTPQLFYGTEILMKSPVERDDGRVRADMPGGWPGDRVDAFTGRGLTPAQRAMQDFVRRLFNWRKTSRAVAEGRLMHYDPQGGVYVYFRYLPGGAGKVMVALNKNRQAVSLDTRRFAEMLDAASVGRDVIGGATLPLGRTLEVPARGLRILEVKD
ncbi:MAG: cyclomaltodextrinase C-terminal domain-containing protein [Pelomonas sp.]|nr:cyclomaltodextrinase C-terminal domain-containing protein [Roseateles sp.]